MEPFRMLHDCLSQSCCICHIETRTILEQLDIHSLFRGPRLDEEISISTRDQVLVRLGLITSLVEMNHCSKLEQVQQALLTSNRFGYLESMMSSTDQLVAHCASKCLGVLLQKLTKNDQERAEGFLQQAVMSILHPRGDLHQETSSVINRTIFTLDLLTNIVRGESTRPDSTDGNKSTLPCMSTSTLAEDDGSRLIAQPHEKDTSDCTRWYHDVINKSIPELCTIFSSQFDSPSNKYFVSEYQHSSISCLHSLDVSSKHKIYHAFLRLLYSYTKVHMKMDPHSLLPFVQTTLPHLQAMLMTYCHGSVANLKVVLGVLILCLNACVKACKSAKHSGEVESESAVLQKIWRRLIAVICEGQWLEKMPYHEGQVGFGGSVFAALGEVSKESSEDYNIGDRMILRKLAWLVILGSQFEAVSAGMASIQGSKHLEQVYCFIESKLNRMSQCEEKPLGQGRWIFEIFGDQDDALIGIMLSLLKINLSAKTHSKDESCKSLNIVSTVKDEDISDHGDEIPAENYEKCIHNAHHVFISFLDHMTWDHSILLDLLISTETDFLEYLILYLRFVLTDWEGFVQVQRLFRKKEEGKTIACLILSSDADTDGDDSDDDDGSHGSGGSDGCDDDIDKDEDGGGCDVAIGKEINKFIYDADIDGSEHGVTKNDVIRSDNEMTAAENKELHGQTKSKQLPKPLENLPVKRNICHEEITENAARKIKKTDIEEQLNVTSLSKDVKEASYEDLTPKEEKNELCIQSLSELGCLDNTMTVLIRLRLAIERLEKKGLFPFSATPLIRLLVKVEDMYETLEG